MCDVALWSAIACPPHVALAHHITIAFRHVRDPCSPCRDPISEAIREIRSGAAHAEANYMETQRRLAMEEDMALQQLRSTGRTQDRKEDGEEKGDARARVLGREEDGAEWEQDNEVETSGAAVATHRDPSEGGLASEEQEEERGQGPVVLSMHATKGGRVTLSLSARDGAAGEAGVERRDESTSERESGAVEASMEAPIDGSEGEERREEVRETEGDGPAVDEEEYGRSGDLRESDIAGIDDVVDELVAIAGAGSSFDAGVNLGEGIKESLRGADEKLHEEGETMNEGERQDREEGREDAGLGNAGGKENEEEEERDEYDDELPAGGDGDGDGELVEELGDTLGGSGAVEELDESNVVDAAQDEVGGVGTGGEAGGDADERDSDAGEVMVEGVDSEADLNDAEMATDEQIDVADELGDPEAVAEGLDEGKGGGGNESRKEPLDEQGHEEEGGKGEGMQAVGHEGENVEVATEGGVDSEGEGKEDEVEEDEEYQDEEFERAAPEELGDAPEELGGETPEGGTSAVEEAADVEDVADEVEADDMGDSRGQEMAESTGVEQVEEGTNGQPEASSGVAEGDEDGDDGKGGAEEHKSAVPGAAAGAPSEVDAAEELDDL